MINRAKNRFLNKIYTKESQSKKNPNFGIGAKDSRDVGMLSARRVWTDAIKVGRNKYKSKVKHNRFLELTECMYHRISSLHKWNLSDNQISFHGRSVGNDFFDFPVMWTGFISEMSLQNPSDKVVEHFYARKKAGETLIKLCSQHESFSLDMLRQYVAVVTQIHYTTADENQALKPLQNSKSISFLNWTQMYTEVVSPLIYIQQPQPKPLIYLETAMPFIYKYL